MYEPNPDVQPTGAEVDEFVDVPEPRPTEPPRRPDASTERGHDPADAHPVREPAWPVRFVVLLLL